jgi:hypothetical protein
MHMPGEPMLKPPLSIKTFTMHIICIFNTTLANNTLTKTNSKSSATRCQDRKCTDRQLKPVSNFQELGKVNSINKALENLMFEKSALLAGKQSNSTAVRLFLQNNIYAGQENYNMAITCRRDLVYYEGIANIKHSCNSVSM